MLMGWVLAALAAVIITAAVVWAGWRRHSLGRVAHALGFEYVGGRHALPDSLDHAGFYLFTQGPALISNRMDGERAGYLVSLFDFGYDAGKGEEGSRRFLITDPGEVEHRLQTVVWLHQPEHRLPDFDLSPTRQVTRSIAGASGLHRLTGGGRDDFDDRYLLYARDDAALRRVFTPPVIDAFLVDSGWFIEGRGDQWLVYRLAECVVPDQVTDFLDRAIGLIDRLGGADHRSRVH